MDTRKSDELIRAWNEGENPLKRSKLTLERTLRATPEEIFPLLCPTLEYDWISTWRCQLLHSASGHAEFNAIFRTDLMGQEELWICTHYQPPESIHYTRVAKGACTKLEIALGRNRGGTTTVSWTLIQSALTPEENDAVMATVEGPERRRILEHLLDELEHYLETGEMLV